MQEPWSWGREMMSLINLQDKRDQQMRRWRAWMKKFNRPTERTFHVSCINTSIHDWIHFTTFFSFDSFTNCLMTCCNFNAFSLFNILGTHLERSFQSKSGRRRSRVNERSFIYTEVSNWRISGEWELPSYRSEGIECLTCYTNPISHMIQVCQSLTISHPSIHTPLIMP